MPRTAPIPADTQRIVIHGVPWKGYECLLRVFEGRHIRITYDRGSLEIMTLSPPHERYKCLLVQFVIVLVTELGLEYASFGSMTYKRRRKKRGLEPDGCFWIQNELLVRGKDTIDLDTDPPPDLALEIEVTRRVLNRLGIYATWKVPEVWRYDGRVVRVSLLGADGRYTNSPTSRAFPFLPLAELARFLDLRSTMGNVALVESFRTWVRDQIAAGWPPPAAPTP